MGRIHRAIVVEITQDNNNPGSRVYSPVISQTINAAIMGAWVVAANSVAIPVKAINSAMLSPSRSGHQASQSVRWVGDVGSVGMPTANTQQ
ncbi:Uncharacterised protein [Yersinia aldovae]|nr:Uncharacterised protein [Yersinia aldovae]